MNYKEFLTEMDAIKEKDGVDAAFGYVKGVVKTVGITSRLEERVSKLEIDLELKTPKSPIQQYEESKTKKQNKPTTIKRTRRAKRTATEIRTIILNTLKMHDYLNTKDLLGLTHLAYPSLIAKANDLAKEGLVIKTARGVNSKAGYNWSLPTKLEYTTITGTGH